MKSSRGPTSFYGANRSLPKLKYLLRGSLPEPRKLAIPKGKDPLPSMIFQGSYPLGNENISHLGKFGKSSTQKYLVKGDMLVSRRVEGMLNFGGPYLFQDLMTQFQVPSPIPTVGIQDFKQSAN